LIELSRKLTFFFCCFGDRVSENGYGDDGEGGICYRDDVIWSGDGENGYDDGEIWSDEDCEKERSSICTESAI
jgi:hypothetical protein